MPQVAYSDGLRNRPFAAPCHPLPPNPHATFYATFFGKRDILRENGDSAPSYSGSYATPVVSGSQRQEVANPSASRRFWRVWGWVVS